MNLNRECLWSDDEQTLLGSLESSAAGLSSEEATKRFVRRGSNVLHKESRHPRLRILISQCRSPIAILLAGAALLSTIAGDAADGITIVGILLVSALLGF